MQDFSVDEVYQMFGESGFRGSDRNFTIGQSPQIWGNFSNICIKINKSLGKLSRKLTFDINQFFFFHFSNRFKFSSPLMALADVFYVEFIEESIANLKC